MWNSSVRIYLLILIFLFSFSANAQNNWIDSIKRVAFSQKPDSVKAYLLSQICYYYGYSDPDTSVKYGQQALVLSEKLNYQPGALNALMGLTNAYSFIGNYPMSLDYGLRAIKLAKTAGTQLDNVIAVSNVGICYHLMGDYNAEIKYMQASVDMVKQTYPDSMAFIYTGLAMAFNDLYQHDSALFYARKSYYQLVDWKLDNIFSSIYPQLAKAYFNKAAYDSAVFYFHKGIRVSIGSNILIDEIDCYNGIARLYNTLGVTDSAIWYANKILSEKSGISYRDGLFKAVTLLASVYESKNKPDSALKYLKIAVGIKDSLFNRQKNIAIQNLEYQEKQKQIELENSKKAYQDNLKLWGLIAGLIILLSVAILLWRNNQQKNKDYKLLDAQKKETDHQKQKVEQSLTELKTAQAQLIQSEKMASLGVLTAGIAHEIQNPLNFVNNFSDINTELIGEMQIEMDKGNIVDAKEISNNIKQNEQKINAQGKRADAIVKGMLQHSQNKSGVKELTDINALVDEYLRLAYHGHRAKDKTFNAVLEMDLDPTVGSVMIVPQDIGRVMLNLYNNSFYAVSEKNSPGEPKLTVKTKRISRPATNNSKTEYLIISVKDNGDGISEKLKEKIFQPFFTTKPTGQGTGLGLSLSYDIIKSNDGTIQLNSKEGEYTEFVIEFPV